MLVDPSGIPLAITLTAGNRNDVTQLLPLVDGVGPVRGKVGRPRLRADELIANRGYDHDKYRRELRRRGMKQGEDHDAVGVVCACGVLVGVAGEARLAAGPRRQQRNALEASVERLGGEELADRLRALDAHVDRTSRRPRSAATQASSSKHPWP